MNKDKSAMLDPDINGISDLPIKNMYEGEDLFSLFMDIENLDQSYHDISPLSFNLPEPQPVPVPAPIRLPIHNPEKDTINMPLKELVKDPLMENYSLKKKGKEIGSLQIKYPLSDQLKESDQIRDGRKGREMVSGKRQSHKQSLNEIAINRSSLKELNGTDNLDIGLGPAQLMEVGMSAADAKKVMANAQLAELALSDPKKAKRIWANRQSAARSKERKMKYVGELERRVDSLRHESTTLTAHVSMLQRDSYGLMVENNKLMLEMRALEQQVASQNSLNEALQAELKRLQIMTGQVVVPNDGTSINIKMPSDLTKNNNFFNSQSCTSLMC